MEEMLEEVKAAIIFAHSLPPATDALPSPTSQSTLATHSESSEDAPLFLFCKKRAAARPSATVPTAEETSSARRLVETVPSYSESGRCCRQPCYCKARASMHRETRATARHAARPMLVRFQPPPPHVHARSLSDSDSDSDSQTLVDLDAEPNPDPQMAVAGLDITEFAWRHLTVFCRQDRTHRRCEVGIGMGPSDVEDSERLEWFAVLCKMEDCASEEEGLGRLEGSRWSKASDRERVAQGWLYFKLGVSNHQPDRRGIGASGCMIRVLLTCLAAAFSPGIFQRLHAWSKLRLLALTQEIFSLHRVLQRKSNMVWTYIDTEHTGRRSAIFGAAPKGFLPENHATDVLSPSLVAFSIRRYGLDGLWKGTVWHYIWTALWIIHRPWVPGRTLGPLFASAAILTDVGQGRNNVLLAQKWARRFHDEVQHTLGDAADWKPHRRKENCGGASGHAESGECSGDVGSAASVQFATLWKGGDICSVSTRCRMVTAMTETLESLVVQLSPNLIITHPDASLIRADGRAHMEPQPQPCGMVPKEENTNDTSREATADLLVDYQKHRKQGSRPVRGTRFIRLPLWTPADHDAADPSGFACFHQPIGERRQFLFLPNLNIQCFSFSYFGVPGVISPQRAIPACFHNWYRSFHLALLPVEAGLRRRAPVDKTLQRPRIFHAVATSTETADHATGALKHYILLVRAIVHIIAPSSVAGPYRAITQALTWTTSAFNSENSIPLEDFPSGKCKEVKRPRNNVPRPPSTAVVEYTAPSRNPTSCKQVTYRRVDEWSVLLSGTADETI
ncbi:hypothetical protein C8Q74DRAFT_1442451 [Fomes fomentarius]|nr:hypothetical protein C8Q74DRAFT_1442451 [Fomes fomentarius]